MVDRVNEAQGYPLAPGQVEQILVDEATALAEWLQVNGPYCASERAHLDAGSRERAYWHYGYLMALRDIRGILSRQQRRG